MVPRRPSRPPVTAVTEAELRALLGLLGSGTRARLGAALRPAVCYATARLPAGATLPPGASKIGGLPDLPVGTAWPTWQPPTGSASHRPLTFFAQLDLAAARPHVDLPLPQAGLLLFFADFDDTGVGDGILGLYEDELEGARVLHVPDGAALQRATAPVGVGVVPEADVAPLLNWTLPVLDDLDDEDDEDDDTLAEIGERLRRQVDRAAPEGFSVTGAHRLGGHAAFIQHPVEEEVVQAAHGVLQRSGGFDEQLWDQVAGETAAWSVLFQLDSDESLDLVFGDVGTVWWAAPTADVAAGRWDTARFNFQCS